MDFSQMWKFVMIAAIMEDEERKRKERKKEEKEEKEEKDEKTEKTVEYETNKKSPGIDYSSLAGLLVYIAFLTLIIIALSSVISFLRSTI